MIRQGHSIIVCYPDDEIEDSVSSSGIQTWISSVIEKSIKDVKFNSSDFMGDHSVAISMDDIVLSMIHFAVGVGRRGNDQQWEDGVYQDFNRRQKTFEKLIKKVENFSTTTGIKKLSQVKKEIRIRIEEREALSRTHMDTLGVFSGVSDMEDIYKTDNPRDLLDKLHILGNYPEDDPRYYIHMIFRYNMNEIHQNLSSCGKVIRYPSIQKWYDTTSPVTSCTNIPSEFRTYMKHTGGAFIPVVTLPVPSKTEMNKVIYDYSFEEIKWVQVMRNKIFSVFSDYTLSENKTFEKIYPHCLIQGNPENKYLKKIVAKTFEMDNMIKHFKYMSGINVEGIKEIVDNSKCREIANIFPSYNNHIFVTTGEQLRERRGFFIHSEVRGLFQKVTKLFPSFCNDIYSTLSISRDTIGDFYDYCSKRNIRKFTMEDESLWRTFVLHLERICLVFLVISKREEIGDFIVHYGSTDGYFREMISGIR